MALTNIEYGSVASSQILNDNFAYLEDLVAGLSNKMDSTDSGIDSKIATSKKTLQTEIEGVRSQLLPIGSIIAWSSTVIPDGWIAMIGQDITAYKELSNKIGKTKLPDTRNRALWGNATPLNTIEAGLPNITGKFSVWGGRNALSSAEGAFEVSGSTGAGSASDYSKGPQHCSFNASKSNAIYGKSTTVQPPAVTVVWIIKYE